MKRATINQKSLVVNILSSSFDNNKSVNFVVKQDKDREKRVNGLMEYSFDVCYSFGQVWISEDDQACALILLPDKKRTNLNAIVWDARLALSVIGINRIGPVLSRESKIKSFHPKEPFSYLWFIGVKPELQNKGKGSLLLKEIIEESNREDRAVYLETSVERNLSWYNNHGFEVFQTLDFGYSLYMLRRKVVTDHTLKNLELEQVTHD